MKDYLVECIDTHPHSGMCDFVYDLGEKDNRDGNHIHVVTDILVLQSPEYVSLVLNTLNGPLECIKIRRLETALPKRRSYESDGRMRFAPQARE